MCTKGFKTQSMKLGRPSVRDGEVTKSVLYKGQYETFFRFKKDSIYSLIKRVTKKLESCDLWACFLHRQNFNVVTAFCCYITHVIQHDAYTLLLKSNDDALERFREQNPWYRDAEKDESFVITDLDLHLLGTKNFEVVGEYVQ